MADTQPKIREAAREREGLDPEREGERDNHDKDAIAKNASQIGMRVKTAITVNTETSVTTASTTRVAITEKASKLVMIVIIRESGGGMKSVTSTKLFTSKCCSGRDRDHRESRHERDNYREHEDRERRGHDSGSYVDDSRNNYDRRDHQQDRNFRETFVRDDFDWQLPPADERVETGRFGYDLVTGSHIDTHQPRVWHYRDYLGKLDGTHSLQQRNDGERRRTPSRTPDSSNYGDDHDRDGNARTTPKRRDLDDSFRKTDEDR
ncbi:hypothetical protein FRC11_007172 [Ceratobasidium sp. 423]|nr:hypothetical protein FRC11_007172 [Ceratobasidium sp. 423]